MHLSIYLPNFALKSQSIINILFFMLQFGFFLQYIRWKSWETFWLRTDPAGRWTLTPTAQLGAKHISTEQYYTQWQIHKHY